MSRLSLGEADKGSYESGDRYGDADESISRTMHGLNRPSFQPAAEDEDMSCENAQWRSGAGLALSVLNEREFILRL
ncbi:hypothetical protein HDV64DRAFT_88880 [Trichoderma sp. TUCIM 5745]